MSILRDINEIPQYEPEHPGEMLAEIIDELSGLTQGKVAESIGVSTRTINLICNKHRAVTPEMALKLGKLFNQSPQFWLNMQQAYDLWVARQKTNLEIIKSIAG
ncbi:MAG: addiction module antidote protein, HigA family [Denitrovibrio sp.]|nr:MAG: addiction module antidote protein, HigA family [Denitrovibrio sp.]